MKKSFLITTLLATTALSSSAWADTCTATNGNCGDNCSYTIDATCLLTINPIDSASPVSIKDSAFERTPATDIVFNGNVTSIGKHAFDNAENLTSVVIPDSVTSIGEYAFYEAKTTSVIIGNGITSIGSNAFNFAKSLTSVVIPDSVTSINTSAFYGASSLSSVVIPDSVTSIGRSAFQYARSLTSVVIPSSVTSIGDYAFLNVPSSAEIFCPNQACRTKVRNAYYEGTNFTYYTKNTNGVYTVGDTMYASAEDMRARQNACTSEAQCREKVQEYKEAKATQMAQNGVLCQTKQGCLNLMDLVASSTSCKADEANSYANCSAAVKNGTITGVNLAAADPEPAVVNPGGAGDTGSSAGSGKRIYTVEEARQAVEAAGTDTVNFRIRYK